MLKLIFAIFFFPSLLFAQAQVYPTHLTLTEEAPSSYVNLKNATTESQKYKIDLVQFLMTKEGGMKKVSDSNNALLDLVKFSPKNIELAPNEKQVVRIMATSFDTLADGEYYIHIHFTPLADKTSAAKESEKNSSSFSLQARIAVAVPIIVRKGTGTFAGKLEKPQAFLDKNQNLNLSFLLSNTNKYFLYGDLDVVGVTAKGEVPLDKVVGLSSYLPERQYNKMLTQKELAEKTAGEPIQKIKVLYAANTESAAPFSLNAETDVMANASKAAKKSKKKKKS
jgi:hypothetical protein